MREHVGGEIKMKDTYKYDDCSFCDGRVSERKIQKACWWGDKLVAIVDSVPAGVCEQCGEKYFKAGVLKHVKKLISSNKKLERIKIPLAEFAKA